MTVDGLAPFMGGSDEPVASDVDASRYDCPAPEAGLTSSPGRCVSGAGEALEVGVPEGVGVLARVGLFDGDGGRLGEALVLAQLVRGPREVGLFPTSRRPGR